MIENGSRKKNMEIRTIQPDSLKRQQLLTNMKLQTELCNSLDEEKIESEMMYDGYYAICTDLVNDSVEEIIRVSEQRWEIKESFRIMKTEFQGKTCISFQRRQNTGTFSNLLSVTDDLSDT